MLDPLCKGDAMQMCYHWNAFGGIKEKAHYPLNYKVRDLQSLYN